MATKSLLVNFAGYPVSPRNLVPENGLAALAGALINAGHDTRIIDYSTAGIVGRLFPYELSSKLKDVVERITSEIKASGGWNAADMAEFRRLDKMIDEYQRSGVDEIGKELDSIVKNEGIDFIGFKLFLGDAFEGSVRLAEYLRERNPGLFIYAGGPHVDLFMQRIFGVTDCFNAIAYGEGEETILKLADYSIGRAELSEIPNIIYNGAEGVKINPLARIDDLNLLPDPVYDSGVYPAMKGNSKIKIALIEESRGCPNCCSFCCHPIKSGRKWRKKDPSRIVGLMEGLSSRCGISSFRFSGSNPPPDVKNAVAREILRRELKVRYTSFAYARSGAQDDYALLKESGCHSLFFGIESGSPEILKKGMNKNLDIDILKSAVAATKNAGIKVVGSVIMPAPFETDKTKNETLALLEELALDGNDVCFPSPTPCTRWGDEHKEYNFDLGDTEKFWDHALVYRLKTFYPQVLWEDIPQYKLNGKNFAETTKETTAFVRAVEQKGLLTQVTDEVLLMAELSGMEPRRFRDEWNSALSNGDCSMVERLVDAVNNTASISKSSVN